MNADLNAAANIMSKAMQDAFQKITDYDYLKNPTVVYFSDLHKRTPVKGIAAA